MIDEFTFIGWSVGAFLVGVAAGAFVANMTWAQYAIENKSLRYHPETGERYFRECEVWKDE